MLHRIIGYALAVLGVVAVALGIASATVWRTSPDVTATTQAQVQAARDDGATVVTVAPPVLALVADDVRVTARSSDGGEVALVAGRAADVAGWVGDEPVQRVDGLTSWTRLATTQVPGKAATTPSDPTRAELWRAQVTGEGTASLDWSRSGSGDLTVLAAGVGDGAGAPVVELSWTRTTTTPWLWPLVLTGLLLLVASGVVLAVGARRERSARERAAREAARTAPAFTNPDLAGLAAPSATTTTLTRREIREHAERLAREQRTRGRRGAGEAATGATPRVATGATPAVAPGEDAPGAPAEPDPATVAIPVDGVTKGVADAWRRRWNVPARIEPTSERPAAPDQREGDSREGDSTDETEEQR